VAKNPRKRIPEFIEPFRVEPGSKVALPKDFDPAFKAGAVCAILKLAVTQHLVGIHVHPVGVILMLTGLLGLFLLYRNRSEYVQSARRTRGSAGESPGSRDRPAAAVTATQTLQAPVKLGTAPRAATRSG
jgi:hypothetical protein